MAAKRRSARSIRLFICGVDERTGRLSGDDAYMALVLNNAQGELTPLEIGVHALGSGLTQRAYAEKVGLSQTTLVHRWQAATVMKVWSHMGADIADRWRHLSEVHSAPQSLWSALVAEIVGTYIATGMTVARQSGQGRESMAKFKVGDTCATLAVYS
jgi:hypothetical protein